MPWTSAWGRAARAGVLAAIALLAGSAPGTAGPHPVSNALRLIGVGEIPRNGPSGVAIGGLSGIDYDPRSGRWFLISDDRSEHGPARFWTARIDYDVQGPPVATRLEQHELRSEDGDVFPAPGTGREASDAESIRVFPRSGRLVWSSEGDARDGFGPAVRFAKDDGAPIARLTLPPMFAFDPAGNRGPRSNLSIEGITSTDRGRRLWLSLEAPLIQDGPVASRDAGADVRFTEVDPRSGRLVHQYAYHLEPIGPAPVGRLADNGVSEILAVDDRHLLVIERSGVQQTDGEFRFRPRLYCASIRGAVDVGGLSSFRQTSVQPISKRLVLDFTSLTTPLIDNVEGMTWGRTLSNGHRSLLFVTDNDFSTKRPATQLIAIDVGTASVKSFAATFCPD